MEKPKVSSSKSVDEVLLKQRGLKKTRNNEKSKRTDNHEKSDTMEVFSRYKKLLSDFWRLDRTYSSMMKDISDREKSVQDRIEKELDSTAQKLLDLGLEKAERDKESAMYSIKTVNSILSSRLSYTTYCLETIGLAHRLNSGSEKNLELETYKDAMLRLNLLVLKVHRAADLVEKRVREYRALKN